MKFLKTFVFVVFMLFLMIWFISLFMPSKVMVTRAMVMHARETTIADAICDLKAWPKWNPVFANSVKKTAVSADSRAVGATLSWQDAGSQYKFTTEEITPTGILLNLSTPGQKPTKHHIVILPLPEHNSYQVEWTALTQLGWWPWQKFAGIFEGNITGPGYEQALGALKKYVEENPPTTEN